MKTRKIRTVKVETITIPEVGDKIYVNSSFSISHGSDDFTGGVATVTKVYKSMSGGDPNCLFVEIAEGNRGYNWTQILSQEQAKLKKEFGKSKAHPSPDIDTPWIEPGDIVNGQIYKGPAVW
jgi:hypothetical protein